MTHSQVGIALEFNNDGNAEPLEFDHELREELAKNFKTFPYYDTPYKYYPIVGGDGIYKTVGAAEKTAWGYYDFGGFRQSNAPGTNTSMVTVSGSDNFMVGWERQTPYYFYFGIKKGRTALDKLRRLYFDGCADNAIL